MIIHCRRFLASLASIVYCFVVLPHMKNTLINAAIDVKTATFVNLLLSRTFQLLIGCGVDLFR